MASIFHHSSPLKDFFFFSFFTFPQTKMWKRCCIKWWITTVRIFISFSCSCSTSAGFCMCFIIQKDGTWAKVRLDFYVPFWNRFVWSVVLSQSGPCTQLQHMSHGNMAEQIQVLKEDPPLTERRARDWLLGGRAETAAECARLFRCWQTYHGTVK